MNPCVDHVTCVEEDETISSDVIGTTSCEIRRMRGCLHHGSAAISALPNST